MARALALEVLRRVATQGAFASAALRAELDRRPDMSARDRGLATELVYGVLRRRAQLDKAVVGPGKRLKDLDPKLHDVLRLGAYQLMFLDRIPDHAAVAATVDLARGRRGKRGADQVNALLRKLSALDPGKRLPRAPAFDKDPEGHIALTYSLPRIIARMALADLGEQGARDFADGSLQRAPIVLRANRLKTTREALIEEVGGVAGDHPWAVHLDGPGHALPQDLDAVREGRATVQDEASMQIVDLLQPRPGERILDACAAPGGKTTCIAEAIGDDGEIQAHDRTPEKLDIIARNAERLGLESIRTIEVLPGEDEAPFDRVLVDAPCSGLGTLRRHPEIRWRIREGDLERHTQNQLRILKGAARRVKPGGLVVYSVCSPTRAEGEAVVEALEGFDVVGTTRTLPTEPGSPDAFFAARLRRR